MATSSRYVIAGGSGFLGNHLAESLTQQGKEVVILTRHPNRANHLAWDGKSLGDWVQAVDGSAGVINLTGKSVDCRYTPENRQEIIRSRVDSVSVMNQAILQCDAPPPVLVQASSLAIYGNPGDAICDESTPPAEGFSPEVCIAWEKAFFAQTLPHTRRVVLRIGFVLGSDGGALDRLGLLTRWFLGGTVGSGSQYISWLHIDDMNRIFLDALFDPEREGIYNATSPHPASNRVFMYALRKSLNRPWSPPAPAWAVQLGAWAMRTQPQLALEGRRCVPQKLMNEGFTFQYTDLQLALDNLFKP